MCRLMASIFKLKRTDEMLEYLPEEVLIQILCRLPLKSILKFTCVCKLWNCIIKTPHFISAFSSNELHRYFFLRHSYYSNQYSLRFDNKHLDHYLPLHPPFHQVDGDAFHMVGCSNGLVCLYCNSRNHFIYNHFIIWNPSIRKSLRIPEASFFCLGLSSKKLFGFGYDSRTSDYKLLVARFLFDSTCEVTLYSLSSNYRKKIKNVACKYRQGNRCLIDSSFVDGRFYWLITKEKNLVLVFDLRDEMFGEISLPECLEYVDMSYLKLKAVGESSIAIIHQNKWDSSYESDIWVMKEYNSGAWMKLATVGKRWSGSSTVLEFRDDGEVLVQFYNTPRLASYNINNGRIKNLMALDSNYERVLAYRHVESLALLDKGNDIWITPR
ncbi:F-box/kelch-repeat protein At3g06240-like [Mercurialis annua]|uniref:F-box/kelch-repeat protein At3g06240-like n=1 Tax=Mercurialis annua TaxID=3986 RepID=UPI00215FF7AE|nr:F-box/kelch-repeat protein At3g06240-like [Mercurialis annua]